MKRFLALVAVAELVVAIALVFFARAGTCVALGAAPFGPMIRATPSSDPAGVGAPVVLPAPATPMPSGSPSAAASGLPQSGNTQTGTGDVPDPNCVAKTTAGLLNSDSSTTPPSCAPMAAPSQ